MIPIIIANSDDKKRQQKRTTGEKIAIITAVIFPALFILLFISLFLPVGHFNLTVFPLLILILVPLIVIAGLMIGLTNEFKRQSKSSLPEKVNLFNSSNVTNSDRRREFEFDDELNIEPIDNSSWSGNHSKSFFCVNCGSELDPQDKFCATCGQLLE